MECKTLCVIKLLIFVNQREYIHVHAQRYQLTALHVLCSYSNMSLNESLAVGEEIFIYTCNGLYRSFVTYRTRFSQSSLILYNADRKIRDKVM